MFTKKFRKYLSIGLVLLIVFVRLGGPIAVLAQEADPTPTPIEEVTPTPTPAPTDSQTTEEPTPTPTPTDTTIEATNSAELNNDVVSDANTGENTATQLGELTPTPTDETNTTNTTNETGEASEADQTNGGGDGSAAINTGDAAAVTEGENLVNTNVINSKIIHTTINLFVNENGDIDLSDPFEIAKNIVVDEQNLDPTVNVLATDVQNYAILSNDVVSIADTGANTIEGSMEATINTGNAISIVSLLNQVNFTIEGSTLYFITINIFGKLTGNIILPEFSALESCNNCGMSISTENQATVNNNIDSEANTGENGIIYSEEGKIETGEAASVVNLTNFLNTNIFGLLLLNLTIKIFGNWDGNFLGWSNIFGPLSGGNLALTFLSGGVGDGCQSCLSDVSIYNSATVNNNISSTANTGKNSVSGENASINTGNAVSVVTLANFVNTNFINSIGFFGFLNIFGDWTGNIGGANSFITPTPTPPDVSIDDSADDAESEADNSNYAREDGGALEATLSTNVGTHVNPGDTVTFFVDVKNPGTGKVYDSRLYLYLVYDNEDVGGAAFDLGEIGAKKKARLTTGLVLSENAPPGTYIAVAVVKGTTGEDKKDLVASAQSDFIIGQVAGLALGTGGNGDQDASTVLGAKNLTPRVASTTQERILLLLFLLFSFVYFAIRIIKKREYFAELFAKGLTFKERVYSFRLFLL